MREEMKKEKEKRLMSAKDLVKKLLVYPFVLSLMALSLLQREMV